MPAAGVTLVALRGSDMALHVALRAPGGQPRAGGVIRHEIKIVLPTVRGALVLPHLLGVSKSEKQQADTEDAIEVSR